jgi:hypothetical protein
LHADGYTLDGERWKLRHLLALHTEVENDSPAQPV